MNLKDPMERAAFVLRLVMGRKDEEVLESCREFVAAVVESSVNRLGDESLLAGTGALRARVTRLEGVVRRMGGKSRVEPAVARGGAEGTTEGQAAVQITRALTLLASTPERVGCLVEAALSLGRPKANAVFKALGESLGAKAQVVPSDWEVGRAFREAAAKGIQIYQSPVPFALYMKLATPVDPQLKIAQWVLVKWVKGENHNTPLLLLQDNDWGAIVEALRATVGS